MNNEDYASYELALKLKECGFNELTNSFYDEEPNHIGEFEIVPTYAKFNDVGKTPGCKCVSAPLLSQAQKWLREVKHISVRVSHIHYHKVWFADWLNLDSGEFDDTDATFATYEEALADGISVALELIEQENK